MKSRIIKIFFAALIAIAAVSAQAATETVNGVTWTYTVTDGKVSIYRVNVISLHANSGSKSFAVYLIPESSTNAFYRVKAK